MYGGWRAGAWRNNLALRQSAEMFDTLIPDQHRDVVTKTLQLIKEAGYL